MECKQVEEQGILERYLTNQLTDLERDEFEQHYFQCDSCFSKLQTALAVQSKLAHRQSTDEEVRGSILRWYWTWAPAAATAVLLVAIGTWWYSARPRPTSQQVSTPPQPTAPAPTISPVTPSLDQLARVEPPPYSATTFRSTQDEAHRQFHDAMQSYSRGEYAKAIPGLRAAVKADPEVAAFKFYLGACYLLTGQTDSASTYFHKTILLHDATYSEQAHFYLAKIYLIKQDVTNAQSELQATIGFHGAKEVEAAELLGQLHR
jgi:tetratricopeptide (TPR) repeat protein